MAVAIQAVLHVALGGTASTKPLVMRRRRTLCAALIISVGIWFNTHRARLLIIVIHLFVTKYNNLLHDVQHPPCLAFCGRLWAACSFRVQTWMGLLSFVRGQVAKLLKAKQQYKELTGEDYAPPQQKKAKPTAKVLFILYAAGILTRAV